MAGLPRIYWRNYDSSDDTIYQIRTNMMHSILLTIEECGFSAPAGKAFKEWNAARDGTGTSYQAGEIADTNESVYAIWESVDISISYAGSQIATMSSSGTKTLLTSGKYCTDNIIIDYTKAGITVVETLDSHGGTIVSISGDPVMLQTKTIMPTASTQIVSPDSGYNGFASVIVNGDNNLVSSNIASGISIFGVVGTFQGGGGGAASFIQNHGTMTSYEDSTVTTIGQGAFAWCNSLQTVSFPACTSIGNSAFYYCSNLQTVSFPSCTSIGSYAFSNCTNLTTAGFPNCTNIGNYAFYSCSSLQTANFPACRNIGGSAFYNCSRLTSVSFPNCTSIGNDAFALCRSLQMASFPACTSIGSGAFRNCSNLLVLSFPVCTSIGGSAFNYCSRLMTVSFPNCTNIDTCAFYYCSYIISVNFPSCTSISAYAFNSCGNLERISFPNCTYIGNYAFGFCVDLILGAFPRLMRTCLRRDSLRVFP